MRYVSQFSLLAVTSRHNPIILRLKFLLLQSLFLTVLNKVLLEVHEFPNLFFICLYILHFSLHFLPILKSLSLFFTFPHLFSFLHLFCQIAQEYRMRKRTTRHLTCVYILISTGFFLNFSVVFNFVTAMMWISNLFDNHFSLLFFFFKAFQFGILLHLVKLNTFNSLVDGKMSIFVKSFTSFEDLFLHFFTPIFLYLFLPGSRFS